MVNILRHTVTGEQHGNNIATCKDWRLVLENLQHILIIVMDEKYGEHVSTYSDDKWLEHDELSEIYPRPECSGVVTWTSCESKFLKV